MFKRCDEIKVLRDPIHGYVHIALQVVWDCLNTKEFQRLRRIRQLGGAYQVYHTAEHSRFAHSLGTYEITRKIVEENNYVSQSVSDLDKVVVMLAGLLHDIGHGPYSHSFELITKFQHEEMTIRILAEDSQLHHVLENAYPNLSGLVASVINKTHPNTILRSIISGQLDADRMDYLLRDAYFTGTKYGEFDIQRILRTMRIKNGKLVVKQSGAHSVEDYIMARYHMYWQVYYHPVARSHELMLGSFFNRLKDIAKTNDKIWDYFLAFKPFVLGHEITIDMFHDMDESAFNYGLAQYQKCEDKILQDLAYRIADRKLFTSEDIISDTQMDFYENSLKKAGFDIRYYLLSDEAKQKPYLPYHEDAKSLIYVVTPFDEVKELSEVSVIVQSLIQGEAKNDNKLYYPKELFVEKVD